MLRTIVLMWRLRLLYFLGARPERLARRYEPMIIVFAQGAGARRARRRGSSRALGEWGAARLHARLTRARAAHRARRGLRAGGAARHARHAFFRF